MPYAFEVEDVPFLRSPAGQRAVLELSSRPLTNASRLADVDAARALVGPERAAAVLETAVLRRQAAAKLDDPSGWLFTGDALQQATASPVARHRAVRLTGRDVHDVTCSIGADLYEIAGVAGRCVGSDLDEVRLVMARHNVGYRTAAVLRADALHPVTRDTVVLADPARRDVSGRRKWNAADLVPPLDELLSVYRGRDLVVKCAPGLDFAALPAGAEIEVVSLSAQVREASVWLGGLVEPDVRRRASVLGSGGQVWTITDNESDECPVREVGSWLVDPDGAIVRAGLVRHYAARHGLGQLDSRIAYLTGERPPAGIRAFRVLEHGRYTEKSLRTTLRRHDVGRLEILVRGLNVDPDELRRRLRLKGTQEASVVLTRVGDMPRAIVCRAERT